MFVRIIKGKKKDYVSIVRSFRDAQGRVRQKTVYSLGPATQANKDSLLAKARMIIAQETHKVPLVDPTSLSELSRHNWGMPVVTTALWDRFTLSTLLPESIYTQALKLLLADRFLCPKSKLATFNIKTSFEGFQNVSLQHIYRSLDKLCNAQEDLKNHIFAHQCKQGSVDVVFFDVTTLYFESQKADALKDFGFSKDCKFNEVQIVLSLAINKEGRPLTYEIFPGNCFEGKTLLPTLMKLKTRYKLGRVIVVADRGMGSADNLRALKEAGFEYIVGARLRNAGTAVKKQALDQNNYTVLHQTQDNHVLCKTIEKPLGKDKNTKESWLCLWSSERARKDAKDRERLIEKAKDLLIKGGLQDKRGAKKYISTHKDMRHPTLDLEKINQDATFDGYYALSFSDSTLSPHIIYDAYHTLWTIEDSFRTLKSFFEARPMFHWTSKRIQGHIMLNFIALVMQRELELILKPKIPNMTKGKLREALKSMEYSILQGGETQITSYAPLTSEQKTLLGVLKIPLPKNEVRTMSI